jgi:hypothetical protein
MDTYIALLALCNIILHRARRAAGRFVFRRSVSRAIQRSGCDERGSPAASCRLEAGGRAGGRAGRLEIARRVKGWGLHI